MDTIHLELAVGSQQLVSLISIICLVSSFSIVSRVQGDSKSVCNKCF